MYTPIIGILLCNMVYKCTGFEVDGIEFDMSNLGITNANLTNYPIPEDAWKIQLNDNQITYVPINYFKNVSGLLVIELYSNEISDIQDLAFAATPSVGEIILNHNKLSVIKKLMFSGLPHLAVLKLDNNEIHTLEQDCFKENSALQDLTLNDNQVERLPRCIFDQHNHPANLGFLKLDNNPLMCNSSWCWVRQAWHNWIYLNWPAGMVCVGPADLKYFTWEAITEQNLNCSNVPDDNCTSENPTSTTEANPEDTGVEIIGLNKEKYNLEKHDIKIYGQVKKVQTTTSIFCARHCKNIKCLGFSFNDHGVIGSGLGDCRLQLYQPVSFNDVERAEYYINV